MLKRGVSPLLAALILLLISTGVGLALVRFYEGFNQDFMESADTHIIRGTTCSLDLSIHPLEVQGLPLICYNRSGSDNLEFVLVNQGTADADGMRMTLIDYNDAVYSRSQMRPLNAHNRTQYNFTLNNSVVLPPQKVSLRPIIEVNGALEVCNDNQIEIEEISRCDDI